jgi:hypothetical protein
MPRPDATKPPPVPNFDLADELPPGDRARPPQITLTDADEVEEQRLRSLLIQSSPPPRRQASDPDIEVVGETDEAEGPETVNYPADYEKDPFARLGGGAPSARPDDPARRLKDMRDRFSLGDFSGALEIADAVLAADPVNADALACAEECRAKLIQMYTARIGPLDKVPVVLVAAEQLRWLSIDHRAGFLLSHVDGVSNLEMILDVSGMPLFDALKILCELVQQKVITLR